MKNDIIVADYSYVDYSDMKGSIWTVYSTKTAEYPGHYVARLYDLDLPTNIVMVADTLAEIRAKLSPFASCFVRNPKDPSEIIESWI